MKQLILVGDSGHAKVIKDIADSLDYTVVALVDDKYEPHRQDGITYTNTRHLNDLVNETEASIIIAIGSNKIREKLTNEHHDYATLISSYAVISPSARIGEGTVVMPGAVINADAVIGNHVIINSGAVIEHDCVIEDYAHVSPNATLTGGVKIGRGTHVGASAVINPLVEVGQWTVIGSGAAVIHELPDYTTALGVPAKIKK